LLEARSSTIGLGLLGSGSWGRDRRVRRARLKSNTDRQFDDFFWTDK
jgi:hypothetical protein